MKQQVCVIPGRSLHSLFNNNPVFIYSALKNSEVKTENVSIANMFQYFLFTLYLMLSALVSETSICQVECSEIPGYCSLILVSDHSLLAQNLMINEDTQMIRNQDTVRIIYKDMNKQVSHAPCDHAIMDQTQNRDTNVHRNTLKRNKMSHKLPPL